MSQSFGSALRKLRKSTLDPQYGGMLTQARLAELISREIALGTSWPHPQTVSDWERGKYQPDAQRDRTTLLTLVRIFAAAGSLPNVAAVDAFFATGGYAPLSADETAQVFPRVTPPNISPPDLRRLPLPTYSQLVGVAEKVARLNEALRTAAPPWLISLEGLGGIGKTALADFVLRQAISDGLTAEFAWVSARQEIFSPAAGLTPTGTPALTVATLVDTLLTTFGADDALTLPEAKKLNALAERLYNVPFLIVIDNLETVVDYETLLPALRHLVNPGKFIITSRRSLRAHSDVFCLSLADLSRADTLRFIRQEAKLRGITALTTATDAQLSDIYTVVGGNPLALKLVVGQVTVRALDTVLHDLRQAQGKKIEALYTYIYWQAWHTLDAHEQQVLLTMPLAQGGTPAQISAMSGLDEQTVSRTLATLVQRSLVQMGETLNDRRYTIHRLTETFLLNEALRWQM